MGIHDPGTPLVAAALGVLKHVAESGFVGGVSVYDFATAGQAVGEDDERDDDLQAVGMFVAAVTEGSEFAGFGDCAVGIDLELGEGDII